MRVLMFMFLLSCFGFSQTTIGLLYNDVSLVEEGYTLFGFKKNNDVYLINNCGEVVNQWSTNHRLGVAYLLENGNLLKSGGNHLEIWDWDNNLLWEVDLSNFGLDQHHDIEPLPNGNILVLSRDFYSEAEAISNGRDPSSATFGANSEKIVEIQPTGINSLLVVWEWKFWGHLVQDFSSVQANYGVISDHPELLDINIGGRTADWIHANGIDYNESLDQIIISSRSLNEVFIIDHSTTTLEAAAHFGGNSMRGGDFLWRWGNPENYQQGTAIDQKLFGQHDPKWIPKGYPNEGKLSLFNNGTGRSSQYSSIEIIDTQVNENGLYNISGAFLPIDVFWSWNGSVLGDVVFSNSQSGASVQSNGNVLFCETIPGRISEIDASGVLVWSYENPIGENLYVQGNVIPPFDNQVFRAEKYPADFIGFIGKDLTLNGIIENENSISDSCNSLSVQEVMLNEEIIGLYPNPSSDYFFINSKKNVQSILVVDINGKLVKKYDDQQNGYDVKDLSTGVYFVRVLLKNELVVIKMIKE